MFKKNPKKSVLTLSLLALLTLVLVLSSASLGFAQDGGPTDAGSVSVESSFTNSKISANRVEVGGLEEVNVIITVDETIDVSTLKDTLGAYGQVTYEYSRVFNGVALARVAGASLDTIASISGVTGIYLDELRQLDTDAGPQWIGAPTVWSALGGQENAGEGVIVGILDSGVWPENPSFSDPDPNGNAYAAPATAYPCDLGSVRADGSDLGYDFQCNNKLIGARRFMASYDANSGLIDTEFTSARDDDGHGSHTASTVAGNSNVIANVLGNDLGVISGVAPRAQVIAYKVCGLTGCYSSDSAAAVEQAIIDGVDVINFSISGGGDPYNDIVEQAFSAAYENGVFVSASAGNSGPGADTVAHRGPWTMTVGASTHDRGFVASVTVESGNESLTLDGVSITAGFGPAPVVLAADYDGLAATDAEKGMCNTPFPAGTFNGEIVVCKRGVIARVSKSFNVAEGGAGGMILYNPALQGLATDSHWVPSIHIENDAGVALLDFLANNSNVMATLSGGVKATVQGDVMASFSSRGGSGQTLGVSKPDVTAPGVNILADDTPYPAEIVGQPGLFQIISGTSMSSPHTAGAGALLKALHPDWTPGQIKSALMMTANVDALVKEDGVTPVDNFDAGSGRIDLNVAGDPGLSISESNANFWMYEDNLWNANYPSLYIPNMPGEMTVYRTLHSELDTNAWWYVTVEGNDGLVVDMPSVIAIRPGRDRTIPITVDASAVAVGDTAMAVVHLTHGDYSLRFPITIVRAQAPVSIDKTCDSASLAPGEATECTITITNNTFSDADFNVNDVLPRRLRLVNGSVDGATQTSSRSLSASGSLFGAAPAIVDAAVDPLASPFGYVALSQFGSTVDLGGSDESIVNIGIGDFVYAGETYSTIGVVSNGYIVVGGGTGADVNYLNDPIPSDNIPNNVLAPFWTDLNPDFGGRILAVYLTDGVNTWLVVEWEAVSNYGDGELNTFQVWIGVDGFEDISFTYGPAISDGDGGFLTVGAENKFGNTGGQVYYNGVGDAPEPSYSASNPTGTYEVNVFSTPGAPGETYVITYSAYGKIPGDWTNCAEMTSSLFEGTAVSCFSGEITNGAQ